MVGRISGVYGIKGWVKVYSHTQPLENILSYNPWLIRRGKEWSAIELKAGRRQGKGIVAQLSGYHDRDQALSLRGADIAILPGQLAALEDDEFYWSDLIGLRVVNHDGIDLGQVDSLLETGANDVLLVKGERQRLIPFVRPQVVKSIDLAADRLIVDWPADF